MNEMERGDCTLVLILKVLEDIEESQRSVKEYMEARNTSPLSRSLKEGRRVVFCI